jgi:hypothetical protein
MLSMNAGKLLIACSIALAITNALGADATAQAVAALKANLGSGVDIEVDEVRVTEAGVACIDYHVGNNRDHAVVRGDEVLKGSSDEKRFDEAWTQHCLGPRGGMTSGGN